MKIIVSSRRRHYAARVSIFLIAIALIAGMVGCELAHQLRISSTLGGSITTPGEGTFTYDEGTVVVLVAEAEEDYQFLRWTGDVDTIADVNAAITHFTMSYSLFDITAHFGWFDITITQVAAGYTHTVGLKDDGTVVAVGDNEYGQCDVGTWTNITQVAASWHHTVGLKDDGTVVAVGYNSGGQCDVGGWTDITQVAAGVGHTVGVESDGTVVAVGWNDNGQCDVGGWTGIVHVSAGWSHTVGLRSDGTVVAVGLNNDGQCEVGGCQHDSPVSSAVILHVGLTQRRLYNVVAVGSNNEGQCDVGGWASIAQVAAGGLALGGHTVGLKSDGTVVAVGLNDHGQCNVGG